MIVNYFNFETANKLQVKTETYYFSFDNLSPASSKNTLIY